MVDAGLAVAALALTGEDSNRLPTINGLPARQAHSFASLDSTESQPSPSTSSGQALRDWSRYRLVDLRLQLPGQTLGIALKLTTPLLSSNEMTIY
jgi:hypothetical protein